jgi:mRNA interferase MazF
MTRIGTMPDQGDLVLIPVPFTDLSTKKRRPAIVISNDSYNTREPDVVVVAMTSRTTISPFAFRITSADLVAGSLNHPRFIRVDKVYTLAKAIIVKRFGKVSPQVVERIRNLLTTLTNPVP